MSLLNGILGFFWFPIADLTLQDVVHILAIGLIVDLCWGFLCKLVINYENFRVSMKEQLSERRKEYTPFVSIIVPCHNSEEVIEDTITSLMSLDYPNIEIIVVDDASSDKTCEKVSKYAGEVTLVRRATSTGRKTGATNFGLTFAKGDIILVIDDDTTVAQDALRPLVKSLQSPDVGACGGNVQVKAQKQNFLAKLQSTEYLASMELGRPFQNYVYKAVFVISGCFGAFKRDILEKIGQYDTDIITEDLDVTWKVYKLRKRVLYVRDAVCYTDVPTKVRDLIRQRTRWDKGLFETFSKHRNLFLKRRFGSIGIILLPEALFMEVIMFLLRPTWLVTLWVFHYSILQTLLLTVYFYVLLEFFQTFTAGLISNERKNALKAFYAPLMFCYRQFLGIVRLRAIILHLSKKKMKW